METGTTNFLDRIGLTERLDENIKPFLTELGFQISDFGHPIILKDNGEMRSRVLKRPYKKSMPVLMVKFSPDFVVYNKDNPSEPFFMDTKTTITPVFFQAQINRIREYSGIKNLQREDIFDIEREAWDVYNNFFPKKHVAICIACPYHPRLLIAEWVSNLSPLYRFAQDVNTEAAGSGTPHVNLHMGNMRTLEKFLFDEFKVEVNPENYQVLLDFIKMWDLNKPKGTVNWTQFNNVIKQLQTSCPWLKTRHEPENWVGNKQPNML